MKMIMKTAQPMSQTKNTVSFVQGNVRYITSFTMSAMSNRICNAYSITLNSPYACIKNKQPFSQWNRYYINSRS